jgi:hypothetical protein
MWEIVAPLLIFAVIVGGIGLTWYFSPGQVARRAMKSTPRRRVGDVLDGEVARVVGRVEPIETLRAPLTGRACVCWHVEVQEYRSSGKSGHWSTVIDEHEATDFFLKDEATRALVKTSFTKPVLEQDRTLKSGFLNDATPELEAFLAARGRSSQGWVFNKNMRYREGVLEPDEQVCVVGLGRWERDPEAHATPGQGYRDAQLPQRLVLDSPTSGPLLLTDEHDIVLHGHS